MRKTIALVAVGLLLLGQHTAAQEEPAAPSGTNYRMERNKLRYMQIELSRVRQLCAAARQSDADNAEQVCAQVAVSEEKARIICEQAIAKNVTGAIGLCNSMLRLSES
jgi:hypothetical protein